MKKVHITLTARDIKENELAGRVAVVIDVLRATSVMVTAMANGAGWIKTVASIEEAEALRAEGVLLGGERHALPIAGFDFSNSPLEYTSDKVRDKGIVLTTTNGTQAISKCGTAHKILIGAFLNSRVLSEYLITCDLPVELVCAGTNGEFSLDDFLCAGLITANLFKSGKFELDDLGRLAMQTWSRAASDIHSALSRATHYNVLLSKGFHSDLDYCLTQNTHSILIHKNIATNRFESL